MKSKTMNKHIIKSYKVLAVSLVLIMMFCICSVFAVEFAAANYDSYVCDAIDAPAFDIELLLGTEAFNDISADIYDTDGLDNYPPCDQYSYGYYGSYIDSDNYLYEAKLYDYDEESISDYHDVRVLFMGIVPMSNASVVDHLTLYAALNDVNVTSISLLNQITIDSSITINKPIDATLGGLIVPSGVQLTLESQMIGDLSTAITGVTVNNGGTFIMNDGSQVSYFGNRGVRVNAGGMFVMNAGTISNNTTAESGGGVFVNGGTFIMNDGSINNNTARGSGGGGVFVHGSVDSTFIMNGGSFVNNTAVRDGSAILAIGENTNIVLLGGVIKHGVSRSAAVHIQRGHVTMGQVGACNSLIQIIHNKSTNNGGGFGINTGSLTMHSGTIAYNTATYGGGVRVNTNLAGAHSAVFTMNGGIIRNNTAINGGGVSVAYTLQNAHGTTTFTMNGGAISNNTATNNGGGVHNDSVFRLHNGTISNNTASNDGGGIWTSDYKNLTISSNAIFAGNLARQAFNFTGADMPNISWHGMNSIGGTRGSDGVAGGTNVHLINNYDINLVDGAPLFTVTYIIDNRTVGTVPIDNNRYAMGALVTAFSPENLARAGYRFVGWLLSSSGETISAGSNFNMPDNDVTLTARWERIAQNTTQQPPNNTTQTPTTTQPSHTEQLPELPDVDPLEEVTPELPEEIISPVEEPERTLLVRDDSIIIEETPPGGAGSWTENVNVLRMPFGSGGYLFSHAPIGMESWSLLSLILTVAGVMIGISATIRTIIENKQKKRVIDENIAKDEHKRYNIVRLIVVMLVAITGLCAFIIFNNMRMPIVLINIWTIINVVIFTAEILLLKLMRKTYKGKTQLAGV